MENSSTFGSIKTFQKAQLIFEENTSGDAMYILRRGKVTIVLGGKDGVQIGSVVQAGDFFGEMALIDGSLRSATAIAGEDNTELQVLDRDGFLELIKTNPEFALYAMHKLSDRVRLGNELKLAEERLKKTMAELDRSNKELVQSELLLQNQREAEERLRETIESVADGILVTDMESKIIQVNDAAVRLHGYSQKGSLIGKSVVDIVGEENRGMVAEKLKTALEFGRVEHVEYTLHKENGAATSIEMSAAVLEDAQGNLAGLVCAARDITERKKAENDLRELNEDLQMFAYTAAHDLKAPLVTIQGFAGMLRADLEKDSPERVTEDVRLIETGVAKMQHLLKGILDYGRISRGVQASENVPFKEIIKDSLEQVAGQISSSQARIVVADDFPTVYVDKVAMVHAVSNLIQNSTEYLSKGRAPIIELGHRLSEGETVFYVRDNGIGISPEQVEKVFELFYRGAKESQGSGLGLAIVKRTIEGHGGRVWIEGEKGKGTTICFTLGSNDKKSGKE